MEKGQILVDGAATVSGELALGKKHKNRVVRLESWGKACDILVGKLTPHMENESLYALEDRLLRALLGILATSKETCLKLPIRGRDRVIDKKRKRGSNYNIEMIHVFILQKCEIKVGDKVASRHGNKGIVSKFLPTQDMPYLQDERLLTWSLTH
ncbi:hypothetical protein Cgig2_028248 [Carnegiea gigantea]|uniref:DNA-directed RNA polymerase n=1 Tax=Carnegiea gigantea TaxID=171969 RepID=A0A9Q1GJI5_9CARY|nr:hypothetical protein Cgig2_028248 [Carnegiea gigantea]